MASVSKRKWTYKGVAKEAWVVRYSDRKGVRRMATFEKKKDADKFRTKVEGEIETDTHVAASESIKVAALADQYLAAMEVRHREGRNMGRSRLMMLGLQSRKHIKPYIGQRLVSELTLSDIERWTGELAAPRPGRKLAAGTIDDILLTLRSMIDFAIKRGSAAKNVAVAAMKERSGRPRVRIRTFTKDEVLSVLREVEERRPYGSRDFHAVLRASVHLAAFCGLRRGEINGLTVESINFRDRLLHVRHNLTYWDELKGPKTAAGVRDVPMPIHVAALLRKWLDEHYVENERRLVFRTRTGTMVSHANFICHGWRPLLTRAGLLATPQKGWHHFHALRHFAASFMIENGLPIMDVAAVLGHEKFDMTLQVYAHAIVPGHRRLEVVDKMALDMVALPALALNATRLLQEP